MTPSQQQLLLQQIIQLQTLLESLPTVERLGKQWQPLRTVRTLEYALNDLRRELEHEVPLR